MKRILLLGIAGLLVVNANAQMKTQVGLIGGITESQQVDHYEGPSYMNQLKTGVNLGLLVNIPISCHFAVQPGLMYNRKGGEQTTTFYTPAGDVSIKGESKDKLSLSYVELPVLLVYRFKGTRTGGFQIGAGPYVAICAEGHTTHKIKYDESGAAYGLVDKKYSNALDVGQDENDQIFRWDFGGSGMLAYQFRSGFFMRAGIDVGLVNIVAGDNINGLGPTEPHTPKSDPVMKNMSYMFSIGYFFH